MCIRDRYWVMSGDDFTLDINNPDDPKTVSYTHLQPQQADVTGQYSASGVGTVPTATSPEGPSGTIRVFILRR